ncbi:hypothetical protein CKA32_000690 [Geitlerinema sp. FC II]|nr:hypothetical protein CKA32_000690 [Geitlerinema sp. FC II]
MCELYSKKNSFQSLEGIFGFFNTAIINRVKAYLAVSIPRRDFWVFQRWRRTLRLGGIRCFNP